MQGKTRFRAGLCSGLNALLHFSEKNGVVASRGTVASRPPNKHASRPRAVHLLTHSPTTPPPPTQPPLLCSCRRLLPCLLTTSSRAPSCSHVAILLPWDVTRHPCPPPSARRHARDTAPPFLSHYGMRHDAAPASSSPSCALFLSFLFSFYFSPGDRSPSLTGAWGSLPACKREG